LERLLKAIVDDERRKVKELLKANAQLATRLIDAPKLYQSKIFHWIYAGDTALHLAAPVIALKLSIITGGRGQSKLDKEPSSERPITLRSRWLLNGPAWDAKRQVETIQCLLRAGAEINCPGQEWCCASAPGGTHAIAPPQCDAF